MRLSRVTFMASFSGVGEWVLRYSSIFASKEEGGEVRMYSEREVKVVEVCFKEDWRWRATVSEFVSEIRLSRFVREVRSLAWMAVRFCFNF